MLAEGTEINGFIIEKQLLVGATAVAYRASSTGCSRPSPPTGPQPRKCWRR
jgi:hypothetical protein